MPVNDYSPQKLSNMDNTILMAIFVAVVFGIVIYLTRGKKK